MNYIRHLTAFFERVAADDRLNPTHVSLYMALFQVWNTNRFQNPIPVTRAEMMRLSKICANATYHKCIRDLQQYGYIEYMPSYHPLRGSLINLFSFETGTEQAVNRQHTKKHLGTEQVHLYDKTNSINKTGINGTPAPANSKISKVEKNVTSSEVEMPGEVGKQCDRDKLIPFPEEVQDYFTSQNYPPAEAEKFYNYYSSNGWKIGGKTKMKNWQAAARNWMLNASRFSSEPQRGPQLKPQQLHTTTNKNYHEPL